MIDLKLIEEGCVDYWYDEGYAHSQSELHQLSASQWKELCAIWAEQSLEWQDRLAYILGEGPMPREVDLLVDMYLSAQPDAALTAAESLRSMAVEHVRAAAVHRLSDPKDARSAVRSDASTNELLRLLSSIR